MQLVNRVLPPEKLFEEAEKLAIKIAGYNPQIVSRAKNAVVNGLDMTLAEGLSLERRLSILPTKNGQE